MTAERIRELNDSFRQKLEGGKVMLTSAVTGLPPANLSQLIAGVRAYNSFSLENDPHGEHDFGSLGVCGQTFFWKIDYYDHSLESGSPNPADPSVTVRVLTIMRADEY